MREIAPSTDPEGAPPVSQLQLERLLVFAVVVCCPLRSSYCCVIKATMALSHANELMPTQSS